MAECRVPAPNPSCVISAGVAVLSWHRRAATHAALALAAAMTLVATRPLTAGLAHTSLDLGVRRFVL